MNRLLKEAIEKTNGALISQVTFDVFGIVAALATMIMEWRADAAKNAPTPAASRSTSNILNKPSVEDFKLALTKHYADSIIEKFATIDADGSGEIELPELLANAAALGLSEDKAKELFIQLDADGNGTISQDELKAAASV